MSMCDSSMSFIDYIRDFAFVKAGVCPYANSIGFLTLGIIIWGGVSIAIFSRTGSIKMPAVLMLLLGGAVLGQVAGPGLGVTALVVLGGAAVAMTAVYWKLA